MRFEELSYRVNQIPVAVPFHAQLTVIGPLGPRARSRSVERLLGVLFGTRSGDGVTAVFTEASGQTVRLERDQVGGARVVGVASGEERIQAGVRLPLDGRFDWFASIGLDTDEASGIALLDAAAFKRDEDFDVWQVEDALVQARQELGQAESEYQAAMAQVQRVAELYRRVADLDGRMGALEEEQTRRRHREAVAALRRREDELGALRRELAAEQVQKEAVLAAARAGAEWRRTADSLAVARIAFGNRPRLDPEELRRALVLPNELPADLPDLEAAYRCARARRVELARPSAPFVLALARRDQQDLWARAERARMAIDRLAELTPDPADAGLQHEVEQAHRVVDAAERNLEAARVPVLAVSARRELARAQRQERAVLSRMGFASWFAYQMQRVDALLEHDALEARRVAEDDRREALAAWKEVAGGVELEAALAARAEIESYAAAGPQLLEEVEPAYAEARAGLLAAYQPFGVILLEGVPELDLEAAAAEVRALVTRAQDARLQHTLEEAEGICRASAERLRRSLADVDRLCPGGPGDLAAMVEWVMELAGEASSGSPAPLTRRVAELEAELEAARSALAEAPVEWDDPPPDGSSIDDECPLPDPDALLAERAELFEQAHRAERTLPDVTRLEERRQALAGEVTRLEDAAAVGYHLLSVEEAEMVLIDRVAAASRAGSRGEPVPLLVDDALAAFDRRDRRDLLHLLARLGEATQVVYLTQDAVTLEWAAVAAQAGDATVVDARPEGIPPGSREVA